MNEVKIQEVFTKVFQIPYVDEKRKRHKLYQVNGKIETTGSTIIYFIDKIPELEELWYYIDGGCNTIINAGGIKEINSYVITNLVQEGIIDKINSDGFCFIRKG